MAKQSLMRRHSSPLGHLFPCRGSSAVLGRAGPCQCQAASARQAPLSTQLLPSCPVALQRLITILLSSKSERTGDQVPQLCTQV